MSVKKIVLAVATAAFVTLPAIGSANAEPAKGKRFGLAISTCTPLVTKRLERQGRKIRNGRNAGKLTRQEAAYLRSNLREIRFRKRLAARDGVVTRRERLRLHAMLDRNSVRIKRLKNNRNNTFGRIGRVHFSLGF